MSIPSSPPIRRLPCKQATSLISLTCWPWSQLTLQLALNPTCRWLHRLSDLLTWQAHPVSCRILFMALIQTFQTNHLCKPQPPLWWSIAAVMACLHMGNESPMQEQQKSPLKPVENSFVSSVKMELFWDSRTCLSYITDISFSTHNYSCINVSLSILCKVVL